MMTMFPIPKTNTHLSFVVVVGGYCSPHAKSYPSRANSNLMSGILDIGKTWGGNPDLPWPALD